MKVKLNIPSTEQEIGDASTTVFFGMESSEHLLAEDCLRELLPTAEAINESYAAIVRQAIDALVKQRSKR